MPPYGMALPTLAEIDAAIAKSLASRKKKISVDGLTSERENQSLEALYKMRAESEASSATTPVRRVLYQRIIPTARGY